MSKEAKATKFENEVPFGGTIYALLYLNNWHLDKVVQHNQIERAYLAWETVRKDGNPYFENGTGFEGYLVGICANSEEALTEILAINQHILDAIARLYHFEHNFRGRLMRTLTGETSDPQAIHIWSGYFGAELGKLRAQALKDPEARDFQHQTYTAISTLPPISYHEANKTVTQSYRIGSTHSPTLGKLRVSPQMLQPSQQEAWLVAQNIGIFGHPLVRQLLDHP